MVVFPELDPFAYAYESIPGDNPKGTDLDDPGAVDLWPDRDIYYEDPNKGRIVFTGDVTLRVGNTTFNCLHTPATRPASSRSTCPRRASCSPATRSSRAARRG